MTFPSHPAPTPMPNARRRCDGGRSDDPGGTRTHDLRINLPLRLSPPRRGPGPVGAFVVWTLPSPAPVVVRRPPSSLYTFPRGAWLGIGLGGPLAFPEFERFYSAGFPAGTPNEVCCVYPFATSALEFAALTSCHSVHLRASANSLASQIRRLLDGS